MKFILYITLVFLCLIPATPQQNNFNIQNGQVIWQKVYEQKFTGTDGIACITPTNGNAFTINEYKVPGAENEKTIVILASNMNATGTIETKPESYRVTVSGFAFTNPFDNDSRVALTSAVTRNGLFRTDKKATNSLRLLDEALSELFSPKNNDW